MNDAPSLQPKYYCPRCRWEMPPDAEHASPGWAFCSVCGTALTTEMPEALASAPPLRALPAGQLQYAGFWVRFAGYLIDYSLIFVAVFMLAVAAGVVIRLLGSRVTAGQARALGYAIFLPIVATYRVAFNASYGTLGKRAVGLRVVDERGEPPGWRRSAIRFAVSIVSSLLLAWGYWRMVFEPEKQTLHDQAAGTYVVRASSL